jgi:hypothetical protein
MIKGAIKGKENRYQLWRIWNQEKPLILFILLNPSNADHKNDDKTVKKLIGFTKKFEFGGFYLGNLYSTVSTTPSPDKFIEDETRNIKHIQIMKKKCKKIIIGWGNHGTYPNWLLDNISETMCLGINKNGTPKHPLYLSYKSQMKNYFLLS